MGTFRTADLNFSAAFWDPYLLSANGTFKMFISFSFLKIRADPYPFVFKLIPKAHKLLVFNSSLCVVFGKDPENRNSVKNKRNQIEKS